VRSTRRPTGRTAVTQTLALATLALVSAKAALLHAAGAIDYAVLALAALAAVADTASWKAVLHSKAAIYEIYAPDADVDGPTQAYRPAVHSSDPYKQCVGRRFHLSWPALGGRKR